LSANPAGHDARHLPAREETKAHSSAGGNRNADCCWLSSFCLEHLGESRLSGRKAIQLRLDGLKDKIKEGSAPDGTAYPEGWLRGSPIVAAWNDKLGEGRPARPEISKVWHTSLTRLFRVDRILQDDWYPGGDPEEAADAIELRDVPERP
jgi:hypothetical protein